MFRIRVAPLCLLFAALLTTTACNPVAELELMRAAKLESQGKFPQASDLYSKALARLPETHIRQRSQAYLRLGDCLLRSGNTSGAFAAYQKSTAADPGNMAAHLRLGEIFLAGGAPDRASEQAQTVLAAGSASSDALALLGAASSAVGDMEMAQRAFEHVLTAEPQRMQVAIALADIYDRQDQTDKAKKVLQQAARMLPTSSLPLLALGRLQEQEGNISAAEDSYRSAIKIEDSAQTNKRLARFLARTSRPDEALQVLAHADLLDQELPVSRADFEFLSGNERAALDEYADELSVPAANSDMLRNWLRSDQMRTKSNGSLARMAARIIEADLQAAAKTESHEGSTRLTSVARLHLAQYSKILDPATLHMLEGEISLVEGNISHASEHLRKAAAESSSGSAASHYLLGVLMYRAGQEAKGRAEWVSALDQDSTYVPARLMLAEDALLSRSYLQAEQYVVPVVRDEPENLRALKVFCSALLGQRRYASAELIAKRAQTLNPEDSETHALLAKIAVAQNKLVTSLSEYERAISLDPRSSDAIEGLYNLYSRSRMTRQRLRKLENVAEAPPASAPLLEMAGRLYANQGLVVDAERCFRSSLRIDPNRVTALKSLAILKANGSEPQSAFDFAARIGGPRAALFRAIEAENHNDRPAAVAGYESAVNQGEHSGIAANNLAWLLASTNGDLDRALIMAERARSQAPSDPAILDTLGFVHLKRREYTAAITVLQEAIQLADRRPNAVDRVAIKHHLNEALFRSGQIQ